MTDGVSVRGDHAARTPDLDPALRHAIEGDADVLIVCADVFADLVRVIRHGEHLLDADVPVPILDRRGVEAQQPELARRLTGTRLLEGAAERDGPPFGRF